MKTFTAILALSMLCSTLLCEPEAHKYARKAFKFGNGRTFEIVDILGDRVKNDNQAGQLTIKNDNISIKSNNCEFGGKWRGRVNKMEFGMRPDKVNWSITPCTGIYGDLQDRMLRLKNTKKGYGLRMHVYGSDWIIIGMENDANQSIDMIIGERFLNPKIDLSVEMNQ